MRKIIYIILGVTIVAIIASVVYFFYWPKPASDNWQEQVLWAQECGEAGIACCADRDPACSYGLNCCSDPNDAGRNVCLDDCGCGALDKFCCSDDPHCQAGLACADGFCKPCGQADQPCCYADTACYGGLVCDNDKICVECGVAGNPCCAGDPGCLTENNFDNSRTECRNGTCVRCGSDNNIACQNAPACNQEHLLNNNFCLACGEYNQPCCNELSGAGFACDPSQGLECQLGFCID